MTAFESALVILDLFTAAIYAAILWVMVQQRQLMDKQLAPHEVAGFAGQIGLSSPNMNFDILLKWLGEGLRVVKIAFGNCFGLAYGSVRQG